MWFRERLAAHRIIARSVQILLGCSDRRRHRRGHPHPGPVRIVLPTAFDAGGRTRTVLAVAQWLTRRHHVEVISLIRDRDEAFFELPDAASVVVLEDRRPVCGGRTVERLLSRVPSVLMHPDDRSYHLHSLWTDLQLLRRVRGMRSGVLITS